MQGGARSACPEAKKETLMIREVEGDILLSGAQVIAHGIAPQDHFDSGLALALRECWPSMVRDYRHAAHARAPEPGGIWVWAGVDEQGKTQCIVNLITQGMLHSGRSAKPGKASLEDVGHALRELARYVRSEGVSSLALPCVATGVGGLDWSEVKPLVVRHLGDLEIPVILYEVYRKGVAAEEKLA
jgi:O-acetyl-ADP-ribose deacetylase (regulator of RNase III)